MSKGVIYILTNPSFPDYIKIGYAKNLERRLQQLNRSETIPFAFRAYAVYEVESALTDKELHKLIDRLNPDLRSIETFDGRERVKEFYAMSAEDAYSLLESIAKISGTQERLKRVQPEGHEIIDEQIAEEVREEHHGRVGLGGEAVSQLAHHDCEGHGNDQSQHDPQQVIAQRVADHDRRIRGFQKLEVLQSHPVALDDVIPEGVRLERPVVLESDHNAEHRQVADQQQPDSSRRDHGH